MEGKTCIITGANSGIGRATALELAARKARIVLVCRNREMGALVMKEIISSTRNQQVSLEVCDLSSQSQIKELAERIESKHESIDVLINNAGAIFSEYELTNEGIERTWAVNHLAYFSFTNLLLPKLKAADSARIVCVASGAHKSAKLNLDDPGLKKNFNGMMAYAHSKLANVMFTYELARQLEASSITANVLHPGGVATPIGLKAKSRFYRWFWNAYIKTLAITPEQGAATSVHLASSEEVAGITGKYWEKCKQVNSSKVSYDQDLQNKLWQLSLQQCGL